MYKHILLAVDLNEPSSWEKALPTAVALCKWSGATLHVVTVIPDVGPGAGQFFPADAAEKFKSAAASELRQFVARNVPNDLRVQDVIAQGRVYKEIIATAAAVDADLVVMASHKPGLGDLLLGATADHVARRCPRSVLVVRS